jgi:hypothetical protein
MKKLTLQLDDLRIESFSTTGAPRERGTVVGEEQCTCPTACSCPGCPTCDASCNGTCDATCNGCGGETLNGCDDTRACPWSGAARTCGYTCEGFQTYGNRYDCVIC